MMNVILVVAALTAASSAEVPFEGVDSSGLAAGDECPHTGGASEGCALSALQRRGETVTARLAPAANHSSCPKDTLGSCRVRSCATSRGPAHCSWTSGFKCFCNEGWCAHLGACFPQGGACQTDTGGSCALLGCKSSRGQTDCVSGRCRCKDGHCAFEGACHPVTATGGTCSLLGCARSRGPTVCRGGQCLCKPGHVSAGGVCRPYEY